MLYGNSSISTYTRSNIMVWMLMAFQGGVLNIGGFFACHRFVSHVTGFATFFGVEVSESRFSQALGLLSVPFLFLCGSMVSGQLVDIPLRTEKKPKYYVVFGVMLFLILFVVIGGANGFFGRFGEPSGAFKDYFLLALLCLICGLQNGSVTTVSKAVIRTTHLTGITTDLGIGLVRVFHKKLLLGKIDEDKRANKIRLGIIFSFGLGSVVGGFIFRDFAYRGFLLPTLISGGLFSITFYFQVIRRAGRETS
jgi:uncharacterized membrane protein YoaK (UPF0700 family)